MRASEIITQSYLNGAAGLGQLPAPFENRFAEFAAQLADLIQFLSYMPIDGGTFDGGTSGPSIDGGLY